MNSPDENYVFRTTEVIDNGEHVSIKISNGRYFQLPKNIFDLIEQHVSVDGYVSTDMPKKHLEKLIDLGIFCKQRDTENSTNESNKLPHLVPVLKGWLLDLLVVNFSRFSNVKFFAAYFIGIVTLSLYLIDFQKISAINSATLNMGYDVLFTIIVYIFLSGIIHELGHSSAFYKYTGKRAEIGVCFNYCFPSFYSDVRDAALLSRKSERMSILIAGVYFQIIFFPILAAPFYLWGGERSLILIFYMLLIQVFFNLIPFLRSDGYWLYKELFFVKGEKNTFYLVTFKLFFLFGLSYFLFVCILAATDFYNNIFLGGMLLWEQPAFDFFRQCLVVIYSLVGVNKLFSWVKKDHRVVYE